VTMWETIVKSYVLKSVAKDASKMMKKGMKSARRSINDFDKEAWLNRAGLASHNPSKDLATTVSLLAFGAVVGGIAALAFAPKRGAELRNDLRSKAIKYFETPTSAASPTIINSDIANGAAIPATRVDLPPRV
jgi:hypothetical protein